MPLVKKSKGVGRKIGHGVAYSLTSVLAVGLPPAVHQQDIVLGGVVLDTGDDALAPVTDFLDIAKVPLVIVGSSEEETTGGGQECLGFLLGVVFEDFPASLQQVGHFLNRDFLVLAVFFVVKELHEEIDLAEIADVLHSVVLGVGAGFVPLPDFFFHLGLLFGGEFLELIVAHTGRLRLFVQPLLHIFVVPLVLVPLKAEERNV